MAGTTNARRERSLEGTTNVALLRGPLVAEPVVRELADGTTVVQFDIATSTVGGTRQVPVSWPAPPSRRPALREGAEVVVAGYVQRRFFRAGGATQSRTEVVAVTVAAIKQRRAVERLLATVVERVGATLS